MHLVRRVANRHAGLTEESLLRIFHAFLMCHVHYVACAHPWSKGDETKVDNLIRKCTKRVLGLPMSTSTQRLLSLGVHNTFQEIIEAQRMSQLIRLSSTAAGQELLSHIGLPIPTQVNEPEPLPQHLHAKITVLPFPRNMHPVHNQARRRARAQSLLKAANLHATDVVFVDAAKYVDKPYFAAVAVAPDGKALNALTVKTQKACEAEQVAIALALALPQRDTIFTDSKPAALAYRRGTLCQAALRVLASVQITVDKHIHWFPGHEGINVQPGVPNGNELAHNLARDLTCRGGSRSGSLAGDTNTHREPLLSYHEICSHYKLFRKEFPSPHSALNKAQQLTLRLLQTHSYPSPYICSKYLPDIRPECPKCQNSRCDLSHMLWQCPVLNASFGSPATEDDWFNHLRSPDRALQHQAVQKAQKVAGELRLPVPTWAEPPGWPP